jgi:hypothetical protein
MLLSKSYSHGEFNVHYFCFKLKLMLCNGTFGSHTLHLCRVVENCRSCRQNRLNLAVTDINDFMVRPHDLHSMHRLYMGSIPFIKKKSKNKIPLRIQQAFLYFSFPTFHCYTVVWYENGGEVTIGSENLPLFQFRFFSRPTFRSNGWLQETRKTNWPVSLNFLADPKIRDTKMHIYDTHILSV